MTIAQLAITWILRRPEVTAAIVGARRPSQIEETFVSGERVLSKEDTAAIQMLLDKRQKALHRLTS
jgi:aryl-alcohol dehydrogenase-like predicted oxidoreductase